MYRTVARELQQQGYAIANSDSELQSVTTEFKQVRTGTTNYAMRLTAGVMNTGPTRISIRGTVDLGAYGQAPVDKTSDPIGRDSWARMVTIAYQAAQTLQAELSYESAE